MIEPTPGRVVWYHPSHADLLGRNDPPMGVMKEALGVAQPLAATIAGVIDNRRVNLFVIDALGRQFQRQEVLLRQGDEEDLVTDGAVAYAEWMPYQHEQARKHAAGRPALMEKAQPTTSANDAETEAMIQARGLNAPRITSEHIASVITGESFTIMPSGRTMVCELTLENGFTVRGEGSSVSAANFNEAIGRKVSRENAVDKVWELEGYLLRQRLHERATDEVETMHDKVARIARVCHEVNRAYCQALGDNSQVAWDDAPVWQKESAYAGVQLHLNNPDAGPEASHESWMRQKLGEGWVYGPIKDTVAKTHPCIVPFAQLAPEQQAKDFIFRGVVHAHS